MKNQSIMSGSAQGNSLKELADKFVSNLESVNFSNQDLHQQSKASTRVGVTIDWSNGTMILESDKR